MTRTQATIGLLCFGLYGCQRPKPYVTPSIEFTRLPPAGDGSPDKLYPIEGLVKGGLPRQRVVLFARSGIWWVQPTADRPFTSIEPDTSWKASTHPGSAYAALLVDAGYHPAPTLNKLPETGDAIAAVATADGPMLSRPSPKTLHFSGYDWEVREVASDRGGTRNFYDPANAWIDKDSRLHLHIAKKGDGWTSAEVSLTRSLGYGSYTFAVRDISNLEAAAVFSIFTWDDAGPPREMNIEMSRWGEPLSKNAQFVIQPYYVPANVIRYEAPAGTLIYGLRWEPGRGAFKTIRGGEGVGSAVIAEHVFTSGIPSPGTETIHLNLYVFDNKVNPLRHECEVVIEKFEYLP